MNKTWQWICLSLTVAVVALSASHVMAVEEPAFHLVRKDGAMEIRDYPAMIAAEAHVDGERQAAIRQGFSLIADYIFGNNRGKAKVAMTAPVTQTANASEKIAMTAPVTQSGDGKSWTVRFIMPSRYTLATLPEPNDKRVTLVALPAQRFAVIRFSGLGEDRDISDRTRELETWIQAEKLTPQGEVTLARYDPPWTLWFLRRNELMIPIKAE